MGCSWFDAGFNIVGSRRYKGVFSIEAIVSSPRFWKNEFVTASFFRMLQGGRGCGSILPLSVIVSEKSEGLWRTAKLDSFLRDRFYTYRMFISKGQTVPVSRERGPAETVSHSRRLITILIAENLNSRLLRSHHDVVSWVL